MAKGIDWEHESYVVDSGHTSLRPADIEGHIEARRPEMAKLMRDYVHDQIVTAMSVTEGVAVIDLKPLVDELMVLLGVGDG